MIDDVTAIRELAMERARALLRRGEHDEAHALYAVQLAAAQLLDALEDAEGLWVDPICEARR